MINKTILLLISFILMSSTSLAENGYINVSDSVSPTYTQTNTGSFKTINWSQMAFDATDFSFISTYYIQSANLIGFGKDYDSTTFTYISGSTSEPGSGLVSYTKSIKAISFVFYGNKQIKGTLINITYANTSFFAGIKESDSNIRSQTVAVAVNVGKPVYVKTTDGEVFTGNADITFIAGVSNDVANRYDVTYPNGNYALVSIQKVGVATIATKTSVSNSTAYECLEQSFSVNDYNCAFPYTTGIKINMTVASGANVVKIINTTNSDFNQGGTNTLVGIATDKNTTYASSDVLVYNTTWSNFNTNDVYNVFLYNTNTSSGRVIYTFPGTTKPTTSQFQLSDIDVGNNYLYIVSFSQNRNIGQSGTFSVRKSIVTSDSINTTKSSYAYLETVTIYGNATTLSRVIITPFDGQQTLSRYAVTSAYSISTSLTSGRYFALLQRQATTCPNPDGCWSTIASKYFTVGSNNILSITWIDPEGDNNGAAEMPVFINVQYTNVTSSDYVTITSPSGVFINFSVSQYPYSYGFYINDMSRNLGVWSARITNSSNSSQYSVGIISVGKPGIFGGFGSGTAIMVVSSNTPCKRDSIRIGWQTSGISKFAFLIRTPSMLFYNGTFSSQTGSVNVTFKSADIYTAEIIDIGNLTTLAHQEISVSDCVTSTSGTGTSGTDALLGGGMFAALLFMFVFATIGSEMGGVTGAILGFGGGFVFSAMYGLVPLWGIYLFAILVITAFAALVVSNITGTGKSD